MFSQICPGQVIVHRSAKLAHNYETFIYGIISLYTIEMLFIKNCGALCKSMHLIDKIARLLTILITIMMHLQNWFNFLLATIRFAFISTGEIINRVKNKLSSRPQGVPCRLLSRIMPIVVSLLAQHQQFIF